MELEDRKDLGIRLEVDDGTRSAGSCRSPSEWFLGHAALEALFPHLAVTVDLDPQPLGQRKLTTLTPTPCRPPETLYELLSNFPPAWSSVMMTSAAERPVSLVGIDRDTAPIVGHGDCLVGVDDHTEIWEQCPAWASSMALSTTSQTM